MKNILVIGCGYIGSFVASLLSNSYHVTVTTTREANKKELEKKFTKVCVLNTSDTVKLQHLLDETDAVIVTVAAKDRSSYKPTYLDTANNLKAAIESRSKPLQIVYTSATSVYGDQNGAETTEDTALNPSSDNAKILVDTENTYLSIQSDLINVCIFRLSEIYGPDREIKKRVLYYENKSAPGDGSQCANMIHAKDIANAICFAVEKDLSSIYNLSDDERITRKELYDKAAEKYQLKQVQFDPSIKSSFLGNKKIVSEKIKKTGFNLEYPHRQW
ncbi:MAG: Protein YeeZ [Chlamydiia bacterium]|nr:Protein YeeZ [Chlamydiia bacterium]